MIGDELIVTGRWEDDVIGRHLCTTTPKVLVGLGVSKIILKFVLQ